jgi:hypothetical protein
LRLTGHVRNVARRIEERPVARHHDGAHTILHGRVHANLYTSVRYGRRSEGRCIPRVALRRRLFSASVAVDDGIADGNAVAIAVGNAVAIAVGNAVAIGNADAIAVANAIANRDAIAITNRNADAIAN